MKVLIDSRYRMKKRVVFILISLLFIVSGITEGQKFVIPVLPDTQCEVNYNPQMFYSQMQWIADKKDSLKVPIVLHVGDVVDFNNIDQYNRAGEGFSILDKARLPYAIAIGNHDTEAVGENSGIAPGNMNQNVRKTERFNTFFPVKRFRAQKGRFERNKSDNAFYVFKAGGMKWMIVTLEFCARPEPVEWAGKVIAKHPNYNVIILTHYHLNGNGVINPDNAGYGDLSPQEIYNQIIRVYPNVRLVLSGHTGSSAFRDDIGVNGNHIYQVLQDYQGEDNGGGYIRLLEIDPENDSISAKMYSPFYNKTKEDYSRFSFSGVDFLKKVK
jgi:hypothetical protein